MNGVTIHLKSKRNRVIPLFLTLAALLLTGLSGARAQEPAAPPVTLGQSIEESLQQEKALLAKLAQDRKQTREIESALAADLEEYKILHTTYTNMLARQQTDPDRLEQGDARVKAALIRIRDRLGTFKKQYTTIESLRAGLKDQLAINTDYLQEMQTARGNQSVDQAFSQNLQTLIDVIHQKRKFLDEMLGFYEASIVRLETIQENLSSLSNKLDAGIDASRKASRLTRQTPLFAAKGRKALINEADDLFRQLEHLLSLTHIKNEAGLILKSGSSFMAMPLLLFLLVMMLAFRIRYHRMKIWEKPAFENCPVFRLAWQVFTRSIIMLVITLSLFIFTQFNRLYIPVHITILLSLLQIYLFTKWGLDIVSGINQLDRFNMAPAFQKRLRHLLILIRCYFGIYLVFAHLSPSGSILLSWGRLIFEIAFIVWCLEFWKTDRRLPSPAALTQNGVLGKEVIKLLTYLISFGGLAFEIAGYGGMAFFWYAAWGRTVMAGLWAVLLYGSLRELSFIYQANPDQDKDTAESSGAPVTWLFLKLGQPVALIAFLMAVILAWGGKRAFLVDLLKTIQQTYRIGSIEFSIMGFVYALISLLLTHIIAQTWRHVFQQKLLARSGMVVGLQESLTTISVYVLWLLGVLIALNFIGLNTTTLTVAFGALGIGLGFGLQNIFNNFISGIILLLERPIQVGDDIQVNDIWATVRKINVRSTIVQTYDNASLIIPNSDLISNQVTNWSFKDKRLRRNILVGVAYGSDVELVRQTLLEAADITPRILKQPKPDVIFKDFGDSALVFNLRIWTHIAYYLPVESDVRFTIDRLFRERKITIAFPQRDVHVFYENPGGPGI